MPSTQAQADASSGANVQMYAVQAQAHKHTRTSIRAPRHAHKHTYVMTLAGRSAFRARNGRSNEIYTGISEISARNTHLLQTRYHSRTCCAGCRRTFAFGRPCRRTCSRRREPFRSGRRCSHTSTLAPTAEPRRRSSAPCRGSGNRER